jgi:hypothetical protein
VKERPKKANQDGHHRVKASQGRLHRVKANHRHRPEKESRASLVRVNKVNPVSPNQDKARR